MRRGLRFALMSTRGLYHLKPFVVFDCSSVLAVQRGSASAGVFGQSSAQKDQGIGFRRGHGSSRHGDGQFDPVHHPLSVYGLHCPDHSSSPEHHHGLQQVPYSTTHTHIPEFIYYECKSKSPQTDVLISADV